jgi:hypothetical protein
MNGTLRTSEHLLRQRLQDELKEREVFVAGAAGRTRVRLIPQSLSLTGYYIALTTDRLFVFYYDKLTSSPGKLHTDIGRSVIAASDVKMTDQGKSCAISVSHDGNAVFNLVFDRREKPSATKIGMQLTRG